MLEIKNLTVTRDDRTLFSNFNLKVEGGQKLGILAPSGSGKTTLLDIISGNLKQNEKIQHRGQTLLAENTRISYVFQEPRLLNGFSVMKNILLPVERIMNKKEAAVRAEEYLKRIDLFNKKDKKAGELSGGEKQRVSLVRALLYPSQLVLLDEAFQSQDEKRKQELIAFTKQILENENRSAIIVSHVKAELDLLCDSIITEACFLAD